MSPPGLISLHISGVAAAFPSLPWHQLPSRTRVVSHTESLLGESTAEQGEVLP